MSVIDVAPLARIPVSIEGEWVGHPTRGYRDWQGCARAAVPIVGVSLLVDPHGVQWHLSGRPEADGLEVRFLLSPYDRGYRDLQVYFDLGGVGARTRTTVPTSGYRPDIVTGEFTTGRIHPLARIEGEPEVRMLALFLVRSQTRTKRCGLWHIKPALVEGMGEPWRSILTHRRAGTLPLGSVE